jgi:recombination DNA repair RAD52 pathway protein
VVVKPKIQSGKGEGNMTAEKTIQEKLTTPVDPRVVAKRRGLSYITGRYCKSRLNQLFGPENVDIFILKTREHHRDENCVQWFTHVRLDVTFPDGKVVTKDGIAVGHGTWGPDTSAGRKNEVVDFAAAESVTDATKRAAVSLGETLGLSLYPIKPIK